MGTALGIMSDRGGSKDKSDRTLPTKNSHDVG